MNHFSRKVTRGQCRSGGFTLIELLVAMLLALFLVGGLLTMEQSTRKAFGNQNQLVQLQDDERLAMTLLDEVIESSGYFPNPVLYTLLGEFPTASSPAYAVFATAGQSIYGESTPITNVQGDLITVRYVTQPLDNIINCTGGTNTGGANILWVNTFSVDTNNNLNCTLSNNGTVAAPVGLVSGVTNLSILYGVKTNFSVTNTSADSYLTAAQMTAADWTNVISVQVSLTFVNPLYGGGPGSTNYNAGQPATITFSRVICVMAKGGVNS
jgi:type IV pilus assembly protein PilW